MNIKQYQKIKAINNFALDDELTKKLKITSELSGISFETLESMELGELQKVTSKYNLSFEFKKNSKLKLSYKLGSNRYKFKWKLTDLSASQFISINYFMSQTKDVEMTIHNILGVIAYPCNIFGMTKKYDSTKHKQISDDILNHMKIEDAFEILSFFLRFMNNLEIAIGHYLLETTQKQMEIMKSLKK